MAEVIEAPLPIEVLRDFLLRVAPITVLVGERISDEMPPGTDAPRFPALRLTEITTVEWVPRVWDRTLIQVDCWAADQPSADRLARLVRAALRSSANHRARGAVMGETTDLAVRPAPDESLIPAQPRAIVTGHMWLRPTFT